MQRTERSDVGIRGARRSALNFTGRRVAAFIADWIVLLGILAPVGFLVGILFGASRPQTGPELWHMILLTFSAPAWLYFILSDRSTGGATLGKRLLDLRVSGTAGERISLVRAIVRTALKLLPWELTHLVVFALSEGFGQFNQVQLVGLTVVYVLISIYVLVMLATGGGRTIHDYVAGTKVEKAT